MSLSGLLPIPLGASSPEVVEAERLPASLGEGPSLSDCSVVANADELGRRWPVYAHELQQRTPFRSVASLPLLEPRAGTLGGLVLYSTDPSGLPSLVLAEVDAAVVPVVIAALLGSGEFRWDLPQHLHHDGDVRQRASVWTAIGMLMAAAALSRDDALAVLRGYAFRQGLDVDEAAERLVRRTTTTHEVLDVHVR